MNVTIPINLTVPKEDVPRIMQILKSFEAKRDDCITLAEACREFGICSATMNRWVNKDKLVPFTQPVKGGKKFIKRADFQNIITAKEQKKAARRICKSIINPRGE